MKIYLTNQAKYFPKHLEYLKQQPVIPYSRASLTEEMKTIPIDRGRAFSALATDFLFDYDIFPSQIMTCLTQWTFEERKMQAGDTIVQQAFIPPLGALSMKVIFGVRIKELIREPDRTGFSYETLEGHVEKGISTFTIEKTPDHKIIFKIHTFSKPGNLLTQLVGPVFSVPYQRYCTRQALQHVKQLLETAA